MSVIAKGSRQDKLQLIFYFFDKSPDGKITKDELKAHISGTILSLCSVSFDDRGVELLKQGIVRAQET